LRTVTDLNALAIRDVHVAGSGIRDSWVAHDHLRTCRPERAEADRAPLVRQVNGTCLSDSPHLVPCKPRPRRSLAARTMDRPPTAEFYRECRLSFLFFRLTHACRLDAGVILYKSSDKLHEGC
jgi:hypothetical protein